MYKMEEIIKEINIMKMDVIVLTETNKNGTGSEILGNYVYFFRLVKKYVFESLDQSK